LNEKIFFSIRKASLVESALKKTAIRDTMIKTNNVLNSVTIDFKNLDVILDQTLFLRFNKTSALNIRPCNKPQKMKVQAAPCHNPDMKNVIISDVKMPIFFDLRRVKFSGLKI
jgi:hypothetical protein